MSIPSWEEIPWDQNASPAEKAAEFDAQLRSHGGDPNAAPTITPEETK